MNLDTAIAAHAEWKFKLRTAITSQTQVEAASVAKDNLCALGSWLHGEAKSKYGHLESYRNCLGAHASFHREAGKVAQLINRKKYGEAEAALGAGSPYASASTMTTVSINKLKKDAGL